MVWTHLVFMTTQLVLLLLWIRIETCWKGWLHYSRQHTELIKLFVQLEKLSVCIVILPPHILCGFDVWLPTFTLLSAVRRDWSRWKLLRQSQKRETRARRCRKDCCFGPAKTKCQSLYSDNFQRPDRNAAAYYQGIGDPNSIVYTDTYPAYNALDVSEFHHHRINHSHQFFE